MFKDFLTTALLRKIPFLALSFIFLLIGAGNNIVFDMAAPDYSDRIVCVPSGDTLPNSVVVDNNGEYSLITNKVQIGQALDQSLGNGPVVFDHVIKFCK